MIPHFQHSFVARRSDSSLRQFFAFKEQKQFNSVFLLVITIFSKASSIHTKKLRSCRLSDHTCIESKSLCTHVCIICISNRGDSIHNKRRVRAANELVNSRKYRSASQSSLSLNLLIIYQKDYSVYIAKESSFSF